MGSSIDMSKFDSIEIAYSTPDRFGSDQDGDPHHQYVQYVYGEIAGVYYDPYTDERVKTPLGTLELAVIDLFEVGEELFDALDSHSGEWERYDGVVDEDEPASHLMILDRIEIIPEARGHGVGLHALARAIRTWATGSMVMVVLTAWPPGVTGDQGAAGAEALTRYWSRLALEQVDSNGDSPILVGYLWCDDGGAINELCQWEPPAART